MEKYLWQATVVLIGLLWAAVKYWGSNKDKKDDQLEADIKKVKDDVYAHVDKQQSDIINKLTQVLANQHSMDLKTERALLIIDQHTSDLRRIGTKQEKHSEAISELEKDNAVIKEWQKRIEEKLANK